MTLADLPAAFIEARAQAASTARYSRSSVPSDTCRYCGRARGRMWPSARTDGHSRCLVGRSFQRALYELWLRDPSATQEKIAGLCDVSLSTVRIWLLNVEARIGPTANAHEEHSK